MDRLDVPDDIDEMCQEIALLKAENERLKEENLLLMRDATEFEQLRKALEEIRQITSAEGVDGLALKCHIIACNSLPETRPETTEALDRGKKEEIKYEGDKMCPMDRMD